jgi:molecular chaperone DnaK
VYSTRKLVQENTGKLGDPEKLMIEEELKEAEGVLERNKDADKPDELRAAFEKLQGAAHKLAEAMYKSAGGGQPGGDGAPGGGGQPGGGGGGGKDDVIDAEFEDKS